MRRAIQLRLVHLMDVDEAVKGLKAATAYLDRTRGLLSNDTFKDVAIQQAKQWRQRIARMNLSKVEDAGRLLEEVSAGSWPEDMKQELLQAVAKRGGEGSKEPLAMRQRQNMKNFGAYMTTSDMDQLRQGTGALSKLDVLASRMYKIGLHLPSEPTSGHVLSLLAYPWSCCALFFFFLLALLKQPSLGADGVPGWPERAARKRHAARPQKELENQGQEGGAR